MVALFRKTAAEPELGDRIAGLTRRRSAQPGAPPVEVTGEGAPAGVPARTVPADPPARSLAPPIPTPAPSLSAEQPFATLAARPAPAIVVEPAGAIRPEPARLNVPALPEPSAGSADASGNRLRPAFPGRPGAPPQPPASDNNASL